MTDSSATYSVVEDKGSNVDFRPRGGCEEFFYATDREVIAEGPSETGKTFSACWKIHLLAIKYPGLNGAIVRKTYSSMPGSVLKTFNRVIAGAPVTPLGGAYPERYIYANGSTVWIAGMDNPDKALSSERDFIYVNQAEEIELNSWEYMVTRTTGRGAIIRHPQLFGDCNPGNKNHWILRRAAEGKLRLIKTKHQDNPTLFDDNGNITEQGKWSLQGLSTLSGMRLLRLYKGEWASPEGAVYDMFDRQVHVIQRNKSEMKAFYLACDEGYTNPAVILLVGEDGDGRWHVFSEFYERGVLPENVVKKATELFFDNNCRIAAVDNAAAGLISSMRNNGVIAIGAKGRVMDGIERLQNRLAVQGDDRPRLTFDPSCENAINEFESYLWKLDKDEPRKVDDHCPDAMRYLDDAYERDPTIEMGTNPYAEHRG